MTIIEQIKAEVERRITDNTFGAKLELIDLLAWLDTFEKSIFKDFPITDEEMAKFLATHPKVEVPEKYKTPDWMFEESEKPMNQEVLDQEIIKCWQEWISPSDRPSAEGIFLLSEFAFYARHFAKWGADHTPLPEDTVLFNKGVAEGKRLMMKEAVEGQVFGATDVKALYEGKVYVVSNLVQDTDYNLHPNDKVRVIICKKEG